MQSILIPRTTNEVSRRVNDMVSTISVYETPYRMNQLFKELCDKANGKLCIKSMELLESNPAPTLAERDWGREYGDTDMLWKVEVLHGGNKRLCENKPFRSWEGVERAYKKSLKKQTEEREG